ncbi:MAG: tetratricopeptide repeat protein [Paludibacteraceae bacterium]|nr:tetratricopeptide repeat protein [Paludibacteraceae bacterium]
MKNLNKIEMRAMRAVEDYIDRCPRLKSFIQSTDKTAIWDGDIIIYNGEKHSVESFIARIPVQVKGTVNSKNDFYRIERQYIEAYQADRGGMFFMVQEDKETYVPVKILYATLSSNDLDTLLQQNTKTIKIDLKQVPADPLVFEKELIAFAKERYRERIDYPIPKEIRSLVHRFRAIEAYLDKVEDKGAKFELKSYLSTILALKNDGTFGWRDTFIHCAMKVLELTLQYVKEYDALDLQFELGTYMHNQKLYHLAEDYYVKSLKECRERSKEDPLYKRHVAMTLNNLAVLHSDCNRFEIAESEYREALEIRRKLAKDNPDAFLPDVATTLNNLGNLHRDLNRFEIAEVEYQEALEIRRKLAKDNPDAYLPDVAMTLNNLAIQHSKLNRFEIAEVEYQEALEIRRKLAKDNPDAFLPDVATTLNNLAILHKNLNQFENAEAEYQEALETYRELKAYPDAYLPNVAMTLNNLAVLHSKLNRFEIAEAEYQEALEIRRKLAKDNPDAYLPDVAIMLNNLAALHKNIYQLAIAESEYQEALEIRRKLALANPDAYMGSVATTLFNITLLLMRDAHRKEEAKQACKEALDIFNTMAEKAPQRYYHYVNRTKELLDYISITSFQE